MSEDVLPVITPSEPELHLSLQSVRCLLAQGSTAFHTFVAQRLEPALGHKLPQLEIRCQGLSVTADVEAVDPYESDVPSLLNSVKRAASKLVSTRQVVPRRILSQVDVVFKPGTMTLVLGQPGSGKTSLLKVLSGHFPMKKNVTVTGEITYNGLSYQELLPTLPQLVAYVPQRDEHAASLTVKETLDFAHACCVEEVVSPRGEELLCHGTNEQNREALRTARVLHECYPEVVMEQLGLQSCGNSKIGDDLRRGISGGERKRVTMGEMEFGMKYAAFMDEVSTGLDSAATFDIVSTQRSMARKLRKTVVMALQQPAPEVFELFDNVLLLNDGEVVYNGPRKYVVSHLQKLGLTCPPDRNVADFLLDIATEQQAQYQLVTGSRLSQKTPRLASDFAELFQQTAIHTETLRCVGARWSTDLLRDAREHLSRMPEFRQSFWTSTWLLLRRHTTIAFRNRGFVFMRAFMAVGGGAIFGTTFSNVDATNVQVTLGILYQSAIYLGMGQASQIPVFVAAREVFYKHRRANFYRSLSFSAASLAALVPTIVGECVIFGSLVYWLCGFTADTGHFFLFFISLVLNSTALCAWFMILSAITPSVYVAESISTFTNLFSSIFAGFVVPKTQISSGFTWIYWINPVSWCLRALAINEYRSAAFEACVYDGENYCEQFNATVGEYLLAEYDIQSEKRWIWAGVVYLVVINVFLVVLGGFILEHVRHDAPPAASSRVQLEEHQTKVARRRAREETDLYTMLMSSRSISETPVLEAASIDVESPTKPGCTPVTLAFKDLWYSLRSNDSSVLLLKGVSGYALPGTMTALMGSSGAGKTTLMDVIARRTTGGTIRGEILLNGYPATELTMRRCTGYCEQKDVHTELSTTREALTFSAFLRQRSAASEQAKLAAVEECLDLLELRAIADKVIRGSSQEQMKKITIGVELAAQPSILFLDEPTSGLDARSAKVVMDGIRNVADSGRTVLCTIHQPSSDVFSLFDSLLLLRKGGEMVFFGELDNAQRPCGHLVDYFQDIPSVPRLSGDRNPATWMLECIGAGISTAETVDFASHFRGSPEHQALLNALTRPGVGSPGDLPQLVFTKRFAASSALQLQLLLRRCFSINWRSPSFNLTRLVTAMVLGLVLGLVLVEADYTTFQGINSAVGMLLMATLYMGNISFYAILPFTANERRSFYREQSAHTYSVCWYFVASALTEVPYALCIGLVFTVIFYPLMAIASFVTGLLCWINLSLFVLLQGYLGQLLVYALPSVDLATIAGVLFNSLFLLFSGFNPPANAIPTVYKWCYYLSPHRYSLSVLVALLFSDCPEPPTFDAVSSTYTNVGAQLGCQPLQHTPLSIGHPTVKSYVEQVYSMRHDDISHHFLCMLLLLVAILALTYLALHLQHQKT